VLVGFAVKKVEGSEFNMIEENRGCRYQITAAGDPPQFHMFQGERGPASVFHPPAALSISSPQSDVIRQFHGRRGKSSHHSLRFYRGDRAIASEGEFADEVDAAGACCRNRRSLCRPRRESHSDPQHGGGRFCAGASFEEFQQISSAEAGEEFFMGFARVILAIKRSAKFVVSRVQGKVVGGGVGIVAASDYSFAIPSAAARLSEFELGIGPFTIGPAVERKVGMAAFSQMSIDCEWREAEWLTARGLYSRLATDLADLERKTTDAVVKLAAASPAATRALRLALWEGTEHWEALLSARARTSGDLLAAGKIKPSPNGSR
jgi:methylglutaconyl-CoA hydratase